MRRKLDLTGQVFGRLTVLHEGPRQKEKTRWVCQCVCGKITSVDTYSLRSGNTKGCGCINAKFVPEQPGTRYGRLTIVQRAPNKGNYAAWVCLCDCGRELTVLGDSLRTGNTKSCGCLKRDGMSERMSLPPGHAGRNKALFIIKRNAELRSLSWAITDEQAWILMESPCFYCGIGGLNKVKAHKSYYRYNGIDRVDNTRGYEVGNSVACCRLCNNAKGTLTIKEFLAWATRIYRHTKNKAQREMIPMEATQQALW